MVIITTWTGIPLWAERVYRRNHDRNAGSSFREGATIASCPSTSMAWVASANRARTSGSTPKSSSPVRVNRGEVSNAITAVVRSGCWAANASAIVPASIVPNSVARSTPTASITAAKSATCSSSVAARSVSPDNAHAPPIEPDQAGKGPQTLEQAAEPGILPGQIEVGHRPLHEHEIDVTAPADLIGDLQPIRRGRVLSLGWRRQRGPHIAATVSPERPAMTSPRLGLWR
jgi:hypothetical protein